MSSLNSDTPSGLAIVVGLKFSDGGAYAVDQAARLAQHVPSASLHLVHVYEARLSKVEADAVIAHLGLYAREKIASLGGLDSRTMGIHVRSGNVAREIVQLATDVFAGLIVLGAEDRSVKAWFAAPTVERVMASAPCPVLVAGPKPVVASAASPIIEPACVDCLSTRQATEKHQWWCARHAMHALATHTYSYQRELPFDSHDSQLGPTGA
jgi:nucleotide-binding universal stress UspA family protein